MKFYEIRETRGIDSLRPAEGPAREAGPGEVLIRVHAVSLNYRDLLIAQGQNCLARRSPKALTAVSSLPSLPSEMSR